MRKQNAGFPFLQRWPGKHEWNHYFYHKIVLEVGAENCVQWHFLAVCSCKKAEFLRGRVALGLPSDKCSRRQGEGRLHKRKGKLQPRQLGALVRGSHPPAPLVGVPSGPGVSWVLSWSQESLASSEPPLLTQLPCPWRVIPFVALSLGGCSLCVECFLTGGFACLVLGLSDERAFGEH